MRSWLFVVLVACGGGNKPAPPVTKPIPPPVTAPAKAEVKPKPEDCANVTCAIAIIDDFSKQMCACKDKACAQTVKEKTETWLSEISQKPGLDDVKPTDDQARQLSEVLQRYGECSTKLLGDDDDDDDDQPKPPPTGLGGGLWK